MNFNLQEMLGGALQENFSRSFEKVIRNLKDINTPYKNKREINIKFIFSQNEQRNNVHVDIKITEKLTPHTPLTTQLYVERDLRTGELYCEEVGPHIRGQMMLEEVDDCKETEEIIDFRKAATNG